MNNSKETPCPHSDELIAQDVVRTGKKLTNSIQSEVSNQHKFLIIANFTASVCVCVRVHLKESQAIVRDYNNYETKQQKLQWRVQTSSATRVSRHFFFCFSFDVSSIFAQTDGGVGSRPVEIFTRKKNG